ncbi:uncharacterized protein [Nerophis lumbriciformis]|uniref:uncharacterized protein isoform X2 n=1 Tax=Nerophis lumbriciformis TaxID=546530 RepID=UPI002ADFE54C|nr:uncharacterized protein LOC133624323 isoform X2 [Nerophis lumbriciformis]
MGYTCTALFYLQGPGYDSKLHPVMRLQFGSSGVLGKVELPLSHHCGSTCQGPSYGLNSLRSYFKTTLASYARLFPDMVAALRSQAELLPKSWRQTLPEDEHDWVGCALFVRGPKGKAVLKSRLQLWWQPPQKLPYYTQSPASSAVFFHSRFFLWCPNKLWGCKLECPKRMHNLTGCGLYKTLRKVLDLSNWYYMATEYLECHACHKKYVTWASNIVGQLSTAKQAEFPAILTYKLSCDKKVIWQMQARTQGDSTTRLRSHLVVEHSREWQTLSVREGGSSSHGAHEGQDYVYIRKYPENGLHQEDDQEAGR